MQQLKLTQFHPSQANAPNTQRNNAHYVISCMLISSTGSYIILCNPLWYMNLEIRSKINPLNAGLNPICHLLLLLGAHHITHVSGLRVNKRIITQNLSLA